MRRLIADIYLILYRLTGNKLFSLSVAIVYISSLHLILIDGFSIMLPIIFPPAEYVQRLFVFPRYLAAFAGMCVLKFVIMLPLQNLSKYKQHKFSYAPILVYSFSSVFMFLYILLNRQETL